MLAAKDIKTDICSAHLCARWSRAYLCRLASFKELASGGLLLLSPVPDCGKSWMLAFSPSASLTPSPSQSQYLDSHCTLFVLSLSI
ncbi:hypothetical protein BDV09DRAFT_162779 [Aspergillus tetrazonus]